MSKAELASAAAASPQYAEWLRGERRGRVVVRGAQFAVLIMFLVLWELLPKAQILNPMLTSYPSALWPTFIGLLKETPQQPGILTHTWATVFATVLGFAGAIVLGTAIPAVLWW